MTPVCLYRGIVRAYAPVAKSVGAFPDAEKADSATVASCHRMCQHHFGNSREGHRDQRTPHKCSKIDDSDFGCVFCGIDDVCVVRVWISGRNRRGHGVHPAAVLTRAPLRNTPATLILVSATLRSPAFPCVCLIELTNQSLTTA